MATAQQLKNARELLDLDVKEVSLVDTAANLRRFLIVKRQAENNLGEFEIEPSVVEWLEKMAGAPGAPTESIQALTAVLTGGTPMETVELIKARHAEELEAQKAGQSEETQEQIEKRHAAELADAQKVDSESSAEPVAKSEPPPAEPVEEPAPEPVAKSEPPPVEPEAEPDPDDLPAVIIKRDGSIHVAGQTIQKAKTFGKAKTATLQNAVSALAKLLGDVNETALKEAMAPYMDPTKKVETTKAANPEPVTEPTPAVDPTELITKAVAAALEPITKRIEEIEKTRNPSQSVEGDGGTDTNTPIEKSIWAGIL